MQRPIFMPCGTIAVIIITINSPTLKKNREDSFIYQTTLSTVNTRTQFNSFKLSRTVIWLLSTFGQTWKWAELNLLSTLRNSDKQLSVHTALGKQWVQYVLSFYISYFFLYQMKYAALCCLKLCMFAVDMKQVLYSRFFKWERCLLWDMWKRTKTIKLWLIKPATGGWHKNQQSCGKLQALEMLLCEFTTTGNHDIIQC